MNQNRSKRKDMDIAGEFDSLFESMPEPETDEEIATYLTEAGYDPGILRVQGAEFVHDLMAKNWRFVPSHELDEAAAGIDATPLRADWSRGRLTTAIQRLSNALAAGGREPSFAFRNLDELTDSDLATILQQLENKARTNGIDLE